MSTLSDEHQRRSPDCRFFTAKQPAKPKVSRAKKGRTSKTSRLSTVSNATALSEDTLMVDAGVEEGDSVVTTATDATMASAAVKPKKVTKTNNDKGKGKRSKTTVRAAEEILQISSFVEPEDADFEVKVSAASTKPKRGKKRSNDEMDGNVQQHEASPPPKRRLTRARGSTVKPQVTPESSRANEVDGDVHMTDAESVITPPMSKKGGKGRKKRGSSSIRKASTVSTASKTPLRTAIPSDNEIDAALEADLDRPLTDDEKDQAVEDVEPEAKPASRRLTRNKQNPKAAAPATARTRKASRAIEAPPQQPVIETQQDEASTEDRGETLELEETQPTQLTKKPRGRPARKGNKASEVPKSPEFPPYVHHQTEEQAQELQQKKFDSVVTVPDDIPIEVLSGLLDGLAGSFVDRGIQQPTFLLRSAADASVETVTSPENNPGQESDRSNVGKSTAKRGGKKAPAAPKKGKKAKKAAVKGPSTQETDDSAAMNETDLTPGGLADQLWNQITPEARALVAAGDSARSMGERASVTLEELEGHSTLSIGTLETDLPVEEVQRPESPLEVEQHSTQAPSPNPAQEPAREPTPTRIPPRPQAPAPRHQIPSPTPSPQSSDAENHPPSSRPTQTRPPLAQASPSQPRTVRFPPAVSTPTKRNDATLQSSLPWTAADFEYILGGTPNADKENVKPISAEDAEGKDVLASPEKRMTVEEWIRFNAGAGEERLKAECERIVGRFESEGVRALRTLEGIECSN